MSDTTTEPMTPDVWAEVDEFLAEHEAKYKMSFGLEYSNVIDWHADFTPRRGHPDAREYGLWGGSGQTREQAIRNAMEKAREGIRQHEGGTP